MRKRPTVIFGTNDVNGCAHAIFEIIANSIDEAREGFGTEIEVEVTSDGAVVVTDHGRGVPMDYNPKEGKFNWELVFCELYAGGKMDASNYTGSLGLNGLGSAATQYASEWMHVESMRKDDDGPGYTKYSMDFQRGKPVGELKKEKGEPGVTGTRISFKPDNTVFTDIKVQPKFFLDKLRRQAMLIPGLRFVLKYAGLGNSIVLEYPLGIKGFIDEICETQMLPNGAAMFSGEVKATDDEATEEYYDFKMQLAFSFSRSSIGFMEMYHNGSWLYEGGTTLKGLQDGFIKAFEEIAKANGDLQKSEKLIFKDIEEIIAAIGSTNSPGDIAIFRHQTKTAIENRGMYPAYRKFVYDSLKNWAIENKTVADKVVKEVVLNKKAREKADAVKKNVIKKLSTSIDTTFGMPEKFVPCNTKVVEEREVYIVEGDSAAGSCVMARNSQFQAIMPIRGKIKNCLKDELTNILRSDNNNIVIDLCRVFGCGLEVESKYIKDLPKFDINKRNFGKYIICTDADVDGMQIRCLVLTMIYRLMPSLIKAGLVYIAETPLYEITYKDEAEFAYSDEERDDVVARMVANGANENKINIARSKGLGENEPEMMARSTMRPETRHLVKVTMGDDDEQTADIFNALLGNDIDSRKYLIEQYFAITETAD